MLTYQKLFNKPKTLKRFTGLTVDQFLSLAANLQPLWVRAERERLTRSERQRALGAGHPYRLSSLKDKLLLFLLWYRTNTLYELLGWMFHLDGSNIGRLIKKLTPLLEEAADPTLRTYLAAARKSRRKIRTWDEFVLQFPDLAEVIIDATEQRRTRPVGKRKQRRVYSGKKHAHTIKTQVAISRTGRFLDISRSYPGRIHDKTILEDERTIDKLPDKTKKRLDKGYDGILKTHPHSHIILPYKRRRNSPPLTRGQKRANTMRAKVRILAEHAIARLKKYRLLDEKYRSDVTSYNQHVRNISALCNFRLLYTT